MVRVCRLRPKPQS